MMGRKRTGITRKLICFSQRRRRTHQHNYTGRRRTRCKFHTEAEDDAAAASLHILHRQEKFMRVSLSRRELFCRLLLRTTSCWFSSSSMNSLTNPPLRLSGCSYSTPTTTWLHLMLEWECFLRYHRHQNVEFVKMHANIRRSFPWSNSSCSKKPSEKLERDTRRGMLSCSVSSSPALWYLNPLNYHLMFLQFLRNIIPFGIFMQKDHQKRASLRWLSRCSRFLFQTIFYLKVNPQRRTFIKQYE